MKKMVLAPVLVASFLGIALPALAQEGSRPPAPPPPVVVTNPTPTPAVTPAPTPSVTATPAPSVSPTFGPGGGGQPPDRVLPEVVREAPEKAAPRTLAVTGAELAGYIMAAVAAISAGMAIVIATRKRRSRGVS